MIPESKTKKPQPSETHFAKALWADNKVSDPKEFSTIGTDFKFTEFGSPEQGQTRVQVFYSSLNFKDALAVTGSGKILRKLPLIPGIDLAGEIIESSDPDRFPGDKVLVTGCGLGESFSGGFSEQALVPNESMVTLPEGMSLREAMIIGTAGFTAGLALHQLEHNGLQPGQGDVLVTGATGGVGSLSLQLLKAKGYATLAWTRKAKEEEYLRQVGADFVGDISKKDWSSRPLASAQFAGAIDNVGGEVLSYILPRMNLWSSVASVGMAKSPLIAGTVFPHILRGVNLLGVSSANCPMNLRKKVWAQWGRLLSSLNLDRVVSEEVPLQRVLPVAEKMIAGKTKGRVLVKVTGT